MAEEAIIGTDKIRMKGIKSLGFGQLAKFPMLDPLLSLEAKAIYAYFCSYTGSGVDSCFPSRDRILHDLNITKDKYYAHYSLLIKSGYITVEQVAGSNSGRNTFKHNLYTIEEYLPRFDSPAPSDYSEALKHSYSEIQKTKELSSAGYGIIPKSVMQSSLPLQAKGIYAYLCVFTSQTYEAAPDKESMLYYLKISHNTFAKYMQCLVDSGYVTKEQCISKGKFGKNVYRLVQIPENSGSDKPLPKNPDLQELRDNAKAVSPLPIFSDSRTSDAPKDICSLPLPKFSDTQIQDTQTVISSSLTKNSDTQNPDIQNQDTNSTQTNKTNLNNSLESLSFNHVSSAVNERAIDFSEQVFYEDIVNEIVSSHSLPYSFISNPTKLTFAIHYLTEWDVRKLDSFYAGDNISLQARTYKLFVESLIEMLSAGSYTFVKGAKISYSRVYDLLVENFLFFGSNWLSGEEYAILDGLADLVSDQFINAGNNRTIRNHKAYMKTIIWTVLQSCGIIFPKE